MTSNRAVLRRALVIREAVHYGCLVQVVQNKVSLQLRHTLSKALKFFVSSTGGALMPIIWWQKIRLRKSTDSRGRLDEETGLRAVAELVADGSARAFDALAEALLDPACSWWVREAISKQIAKFGPRAAEPLLAVLARPGVGSEIDQKYDLRVRKNAIKALADLSELRAREPLAEILRTSSCGAPYRTWTWEESDMRMAAVGAFARLAGPGSVTTLTELLERHGDCYVRSEAAYHLGDLKDASTIRALSAALRDHEWGVRKTAAKALKAFGALPPDLLAEIETVHEENLALWLETDSEWSRQAGNPSLGGRPLGIALQHMPREWVRRHHGNWDHRESLDLVQNLQASAFWPMTPKRVEAALERIKIDYLWELFEFTKPEPPRDDLEIYYDSDGSSPTVQGFKDRRLAREWSARKLIVALPRVLDALKHQDSYVREHAAALLGEMECSSVWVFPATALPLLEEKAKGAASQALADALNDDSSAVQEAVKKALARFSSRYWPTGFAS